MNWTKLLPELREEYGELIAPNYDIDQIMSILAAVSPKMLEDAFSYAVSAMADQLASWRLRPTHEVREAITILSLLRRTFSKIKYDDFEFDCELTDRNFPAFEAVFKDGPQKNDGFSKFS